MSVMYGADADELERIAGEFRRAADELDSEGTVLTGILNRVSWLGDVATRYLDNWTGVQIPKIGLSTQFLREAADQLERNARDQRETSRAEQGGGFSGLVDRAIAAAREAAEAVARAQAIVAQLGAELVSMADAEPGVQAAWWAALTDEQRAALIAAMPAAVLGLQGISADDRLRAQESFQTSIADEIETGSGYVRGHIEVDVWLVSAEAGFEATRTTFADGSIEVSFGAELGGGVNAEFVKVMSERGVAGTYRFDSQADYDEFMQGMIDEITNDLNLGDTAIEIAEYLLRNGDHLESVEVSAGVSVSAEIGNPGSNADIEVGVGVSAEYNFSDRETTLSASAHVDASVDLSRLGIEASGSGEVEGSVVFDEHGSPTSIILEVSYEGSASVDILTQVDPTGATQGGGAGATRSGSATVTFDLTDPVVAAEMNNAVDSLIRGDINAALGSASELRDRSQIVIQQFEGHETRYGYDVHVSEGSITVGGETATATYIKPPNSDFFEAN